jgi:hypothetical protein
VCGRSATVDSRGQKASRRGVEIENERKKRNAILGANRRNLLKIFQHSFPEFTVNTG